MSAAMYRLAKRGSLGVKFGHPFVSLSKLSDKSSPAFIWLFPSSLRYFNHPLVSFFARRHRAHLGLIRPCASAFWSIP